MNEYSTERLRELISICNRSEIDLLVRAVASINNGLSASQIGEVYERGEWGAKVDMAEAYYWYSLGMARGESVGYFGVGRFFLSGLVEEKNVEKGLEYIKKAASRGLMEASVAVAFILYKGHIVPADLAAAAAYAESPANSGFIVAKYIRAKVDISSGKWLRGMLGLWRCVTLGVSIYLKDRHSKKLYMLELDR